MNLNIVSIVKTNIQELGASRYFLKLHLLRRFSYRYLNNLHKRIVRVAFPLLRLKIALVLVACRNFLVCLCFCKDEQVVSPILQEVEQQAYKSPINLTDNIVYSPFYMYYKYYSWILLLFLIISPIQADMKGELKSFYNSLTDQSNITKGGSFKDQSGGYYTGGSVSTRVPARNTQIATIQMPSVKAGCGGIDAFTGGFSHISGKELIASLRKIASSMTTYAFSLAIQTMSPQIYNVMNELNAIAAKVNDMNINSCEAAATLLGGVMPRNDQTSAHLCKTMGTSLGTFSDHAAARQGCGSGGKRSGVLKNKSGEFAKTLVGEYNIAWEAIKEVPFLAKDQDTAELFMTLAGTLVSKESGDSYKLFTFPSKASNDLMLNMLLEGGENKIYRCGDKDKCLTVSTKNLNFAASDAFYSKVSDTLRTLVKKIYEDTKLTVEEQSFLNATRLPVYKILNVITAFKKGNAPINVNEYSEVIALDMVYTYILNVLDIVSQNISKLKSHQIDNTQINRFSDDLNKVRLSINQKQQSVYSRLQTLLSMIQKTKMLEKHLHAQFEMEGRSHD